MAKGRGVSRKQFHSRDKKVTRMTRDGLIERNLVTAEEKRISGRLSDFAFRKEVEINQKIPESRTKKKQKRQGYQPPSPWLETNYNTDTDANRTKSVVEEFVKLEVQKEARPIEAKQEESVPEPCKRKRKRQKKKEQKQKQGNQNLPMRAAQKAHRQEHIPFRAVEKQAERAFDQALSVERVEIHTGSRLSFEKDGRSSFKENRNRLNKKKNQIAARFSEHTAVDACQNQMERLIKEEGAGVEQGNEAFPIYTNIDSSENGKAPCLPAEESFACQTDSVPISMEPSSHIEKPAMNGMGNFSQRNILDSRQPIFQKERKKRAVFHKKDTRLQFARQESEKEPPRKEGVPKDDRLEPVHTGEKKPSNIKALKDRKQGEGAGNGSFSLSHSATEQPLADKADLKFTKKQEKQLRRTEKKLNKTAKKLEIAEEKLPCTWHVAWKKDYDSKTGKRKRRLHFEKEVCAPCVEQKGNIASNLAFYKDRFLAVSAGDLEQQEEEKSDISVDTGRLAVSLAEDNIRQAFVQYREKRAKVPFQRVSRLEKRLQKLKIKRA